MRTQNTDLEMQGKFKIRTTSISENLNDGEMEYEERTETLALGTKSGNKYFVSLEQFSALEKRVKQLETST